MNRPAQEERVLRAQHSTALLYPRHIEMHKGTVIPDEMGCSKAL